ncbi:hypothetical protein ACLB2K_016831 [Fragaria x ananassa]
MQGLHHQQQQLVALLSVALPKDDSASASKPDDDDSARLAAVNNLHRTVLYPPNSLLVTHCASFLAQGFSQLLSDKCFGVRQEAAVAYGALCAVICSIPIASNGRHNHVMLGSLVDRFIGWALPLFNNISAGDGTTELALDGLREFLNVGDVGAIERYALPILKACQVLLEDERTSLSLLHHLLGVLTLISLKFSRYFQPHFLDIVDLLLGWALVPDLAESDRRIIMDSFLQFQNHWVGNLQFSLGLLSKFVGDMDVLIQDISHGTPQQFRRLLALLSCFSTKFGLLPISVQKILQFDSPISQLRLHPNHLVTGSSAATYIFLLQHRNNEVVEQALTTLTEELELLRGMLEKTLGHDNGVLSCSKTYSEHELYALIKFDMKVLLSCVLFSGDSSYSLIGQPDIAALYLMRSEKLVNFIIEKFNPFDLPILEYADLQVNVLKTFDRLTVVKFFSTCSLSCQSSKKSSVVTSGKLLNSESLTNEHFVVVVENLRKYSLLFVKALHVSSPLAVKVTALDWVQRFCQNVIAFNEKSDTDTHFYEIYGSDRIIGNMLYSMLDAASDREPKVRSHVAIVLELLLQARLVHPFYFNCMAEMVLGKLGDPDINIKSAFVRLLAIVVPTTLYACGLHDYGTSPSSRAGVVPVGNNSNLQWKQVFSLKQLPQQLHSQQLVTILSYISQRWKVPLSSWIQRLIHSCRSSKDLVARQPEETGNVANGVWLDIKVDDDFLEKHCSVNNLAGAWWAVQETARYCISTRLRTNLGGPTQTFAALERMLLDVAHLLQYDSEQTDGNLSMIGSSGAHLLPMRLLFDFVEALKKNVYNAYEGSAVLPSATRSSSLFFRANKKVCEEWFSRICEPMMNAGLALQCHDATIHYSALRLQELRNRVTSALNDKSRVQVTEHLHNIKGRFSADILRVLRHTALALCKTHESEALVGLEKWVSLTFSPFLVEENQSSNSRIFGPITWITGLVYQAKGQYEKAAAHFTHLLQSEESLSSLGSDGVQFVIARIIECYTSVSDWKSLESWLLELQTLRAKHAGKSYCGALTTTGNEINAIHALVQYDEGEYQAAWGCLGLTPKSSSELAIDPKLALQRSEQMLLQAMLFQNDQKVDKVPHELEKARLMLEETLTVLPLDGLDEAAIYATQLHCIFAFEEFYKIKGSQDKPRKLQSVLSSYVHFMQPDIGRVHQDCAPWLKVLRVYRTISPVSPATLKLCMNLLSLACKRRNLLLANRLNNYLKDHLLSSSGERHQDFLISNLQYEGILLMHVENNLEDALTNLWSFVSPIMISSPSVEFDADNSTLKAKACLKLSNWLKKKYTDSRLTEIIVKMRSDFDMANSSSPSIGGPSFLDEISISKPPLGPIVEELVGTATKLSTHLCPTMGKSWISYASWCFSQAKQSLLTPDDNTLRSCSFSPSLVHEVLPERFKLTEDEIIKVKKLISQIFQNKDDAGFPAEQEVDPAASRNDNTVMALMLQVLNIIETLSGAPGVEDSSEDCLSAAVASQLKTCFLQANIGLNETDIFSVVNELVALWWCLRRRRVSLFGHAAQGFIQYLSYSSAKICHSGLVDSGPEPLKQKSGSYTLRATLYVLHILLNYGAELKDTLEPALSTVPLSPWQEVTPQLFARLSSHPEQVVRKQLEGLLMMLAKQSPCSIVYPTLVDVNAYEEKPSEELEHILGCLSELYPRLIQDVQLVINELGNVTVLWEELWLSTLQDLHTDVTRRINVLKEEAARIAENVTLSQSEKNKINAAKYSAMMAPIVVALERRLSSTSRKPETPHELWFHEEYKDRLKSAIIAFKTPPASVTALGDAWCPFDTIAASLESYQRKSSICLSEVAPQLALLSSSDVPMPGLEKQDTVSESDRGLSANLQGIVTIASFSEDVAIISTKTKPKKLVILGSDGQKYTYLLKGREDLRLDARIMQLLQAINCFLHSSVATHSHFLGVRYYSVTPISGRAGLIQWVGNVISIYSVFKSWQNRIQLAQLSAVGGGNLKGSVPPVVPRPSDMFYGKIIPALKEKGIRRVISRRDWPHEVKRKVLMDLMEETPRQLLYQELWCASEGFKSFSLKQKRFSGSVAAMSMVGHILGLGDRHLDNILMDFCSGDMVHIDYNVCFDKGQRLKIPEIVPFRLTQTIEAALGMTGIEGTFRSNCESVIGVLRKNKDIILMLLEVFVWDPLVEWTRGDFHDDAAIGGEERKGMELAVSLSLFASRVQEIRVPLQEHHDLLLSTLPAVESALERFADVLSQYELASTLFYQADQERSNLILQETAAKSIVSDATSNSEKTRALFEVQAREFAQAKALVAEKSQEAATWKEQHGRILDALRCNLLKEINAFLKLSSMQENFSLTSAVLVAGIPLTIVPEPTQAQCYDIDREVAQLVSELDDGLSSATAALEVYSLALQRILPLNYITTSAVHGWSQILQLSLGTLSSDILSLARRQGSELISKVYGDNFDSVKHSHDDLCRKVEKYSLEIEKLEQECTELVHSIGSETESQAKDRLLSSFMRYMQSAGIAKIEDATSSIQFGQSKYDARLQGELNEKREKVIFVLSTAAGYLYNEVKLKVLNILSDSTERRTATNQIHYEFETIFSGFEEQVEKCILLAGFVNELQQLIGRDTLTGDTEKGHPGYGSDRNWAAIFKTILLSFKSLIGQMTEAVLPDVIRSAISLKPEVMDAFGFISQIRGSIDTVLEQFIEVEMERASLVELEQNYFVRVGLITEQQLALEEAAMKGRDHLSWEEAEELASQEEACRAQLDQLHQTWNQRDLRTSALIKREADIKNALTTSAHHFQSLVGVIDEREMHASKSKVLLALLVKPFSELEAIDKVLSSVGGSYTSHSNEVPKLIDLVTSGYPVSEYVWKLGSLLNLHSFFVWKIGVIDSFLDSCMNDVASYMDQTLAFDQLFNVVKRKLEMQLQEHLRRYLKERVGPSFLASLDKEIERLKQLTEGGKEVALDHVMNEVGALEKVQLMLEEFCNAHETARSARVAVSGMKRQVNELREALCKTGLEIAQMEWMHDATLVPSYSSRVKFQKFLGGTEHEWKLAQSTMETASSGLSSATNELSIASLKAKSASGDLQSTVLAMRDCACEASVALMAYAGVSNRHSTLTSECGFMLEEVLAITEDLHDVHSLGREAAAVHRSLVEDLSKANAILLPLETVLSKDVAAMTDAMCRERNTKMEISPIHGQAIYQSYSLKIREACQALDPLLPSLTSSVKGLYSMLTRLARTASLHAGNLHKALEGLGESQEVESPVTDVSRPDLAADAAGFDDKERENLSMSNGESTNDFGGVGLPLEDKGWLSPPDSICSSSTDSGITSTEMSLPGSCNDQEDIKQQLLHGTNSRGAIDFQTTTPCSPADCQEMLDSLHISKYTEADNTHIGSFKSTPTPSDVNGYPLALALPRNEPVRVCPDTSGHPNENIEVVVSGGKDEILPLNKVIVKDETRDVTHVSSRVGRGKNPYAMSVLRRVEMKLDGRDISDNRETAISEQVDYLLKQATSVDNLCNMYEVSRGALPLPTRSESVSQVYQQCYQQVAFGLEGRGSYLACRDLRIMSALVDIWSNESKGQSQKDQTLPSSASASTSTDVGVSQARGMISSTLLAPVFGRVMLVNSVLTRFSSEASVFMLVECFSP